MNQENKSDCWSVRNAKRLIERYEKPFFSWQDRLKRHDKASQDPLFSSIP